MFEYFLFDFDGTLMDTSPGVYNSFDRVVNHYKLGIDRSVYRRMIGPPLRESFANILGLPENEIVNAMAKYREYYSVTGMYEADFYPGVLDVIRKLRSMGKRIFVATSKPEIYARSILEKKGVLDLFDFVGGSDIEEKGRVEKVDVVKYVLESNQIEDLSKCLMIGDRFYDVNGAHLAGIKCAGILWGFGSRSEMEECGADYIVSDPGYIILCGD
ncbi:MAG: HAD hydrolase-like protein [Treponema sp.]|nr:HAD hydrolase-like protein [Spirochaetia bacterium]MDY3757839.1 HAD hydrolase-like protein [Treponema sp.]